MEDQLHFKYMNSPIGLLKLSATINALLELSFTKTLGEDSFTQPDILTKTNEQLDEYFKGTRTEFDLDLAPIGTTFQKEVWKNVSQIKFGATASYLEIAKQTGSEKNTRAVGMANGKNPIPIIIPCHRIIATNGKLTGYSGGLEKKRWLLQHELHFTKHSNFLF